MKGKGLITSLLAILILGHARLLTAEGSPSTAATNSSPQISFDDPSHPSFFNYQHYSVLHGGAGETKQSWERLAPADRGRKVLEGERYLDARRAELLKKPTRTSEDREFLAAVWPENTASSGRQGEGPKNNFEKPVATLNGQVAKLNQAISVRNGDWRAFFDGGQGAAAVAGVSADSPTRMPSGQSIRLSPPSPAKPLDVSQVPGHISDSRSATGKATPFAVGSIILALGYLGIRKLRNGTSSAPSASDRLDSLRSRVAEELGKRPGHETALGTPASEPRLKTASCEGCEGSCSGTCSGGCQGNCTGDCWGSCAGGCSGCTGDCSGSCAGNCSAGCSGGCFGDCKGACALNKSQTTASSSTDAGDALRQALSAHGYPL